MSKCIGIDFGDDAVVAAVADGESVRVLDNREGKDSTPSVVGLRRRKGREDEIVVGQMAVSNWPMAPKDTIISVRRLLGRTFDDPEVQKVKDKYEYEIVESSVGTRGGVRVVMGGQEYSPKQISAMILKKVREDAEFRLGEEVTAAVITVPAYFSLAQKAATGLAGQLAGLRVIRVLEEPTAAAIAYGVDSTESTEPKYILVYDLGGGTFDISVLMWAGNVFAPLTLEGDMWLGGDNFDQAIVDRVVEYVKNEYGIDPKLNLRFMAMLRKEARDAKERLNASGDTEIIIPGTLTDRAGEFIDVEMNITKDQFQDMIRPLIQETIRLAENALSSAGLTIGQLAQVLLTGDSTRVPLVKEMLDREFGAERVQRKMHPQFVVAMGAAKAAKVLIGLETTGPPPGGIAPFSYGFQIDGDKYDVIVRRLDPYPTPQESRQPRVFRTRIPNQRTFRIPIYGGDNMQKASANEKQGETIAVLPPGLPSGSPVTFVLWLDQDGVFELDAHFEDETDVKSWIMKGGLDQRAVEMLEECARERSHLEDEFDETERTALDCAYSVACDALCALDQDKALRCAEAYRDRIWNLRNHIWASLRGDPLWAEAESQLRQFRIEADRLQEGMDIETRAELEQRLIGVEEALSSRTARVALLRLKKAELWLKNSDKHSPVC